MQSAWPKIAVIHDFLYCYGGAERVLEQILEIFPNADLFSLIDFLPADCRDFIKGKPVRCSFIQHLPFARRRHRAYLPLMPLAVEQLDVSEYDIVISNSYLAAKGILVRPDQLHICYCCSPVRFAWDLQHQYLQAAKLRSGIRSILIRMILHYIRIWDCRSANGVDVFVASSNFVKRRIEKAYRRKAMVIYPPVDIEKFPLHRSKEDFYLTASRMVPYKRIDLVVEAFASMPDRRLIVVGTGPDFNKIKAKATPNVSVLGYQPEDQLRSYMQRARAFIFAGEEDFGIVAVEAQACGTPIIAFGRGGMTESVIDGKTGLFFQEQSVESLVDAVHRFERMDHWQPVEIRENILRFSLRRFRQQFSTLVREKWSVFEAGLSTAALPVKSSVLRDL